MIGEVPLRSQILWKGVRNMSVFAPRLKKWSLQAPKGEMFSSEIETLTENRLVKKNLQLKGLVKEEGIDSHPIISSKILAVRKLDGGDIQITSDTLQEYIVSMEDIDRAWDEARKKAPKPETKAKGSITPIRHIA